MLIKTRKSFMFWDSSVNRPREMSLPQLPPWGRPRGQLGSRAQLVGREWVCVAQTCSGTHFPSGLSPRPSRLVSLPHPFSFLFRSGKQGQREGHDGPRTRTSGAVLRVTTHPGFPGAQGVLLLWDSQVPTPRESQADRDGWSLCGPGAPPPLPRGTPFSPFRRGWRR